MDGTVRGLSSSLAVSPRSELRSITLDLDYIQLLDLNVELRLWRQLAGKNVLEVLEVKMEEEIKRHSPRRSGKRRYIHKITEAQFPQLLESATIEFKFYTRTVDK